MRQTSGVISSLKWPHDQVVSDPDCHTALIFSYDVPAAVVEAVETPDVKLC